jgi:hypothetical protein
MSVKNQLSAATKLYDLGQWFVIARNVADHLWRDDDQDPLNSPGLASLSDQTFSDFASLIASMRVAIQTVADNFEHDPVAARLQELSTRLGVFWLWFRESWEGENRHAKLKQLRDLPPDADPPHPNWLLKGSPIMDGTWDKIQEAVRSVQKELPRGLKAIFNVGQLVASRRTSEMLSTPRCALEPGYREFYSELTQNLAQTHEHFPSLSFQFELPAAASETLCDKLDHLHNQISATLRRLTTEGRRQTTPASQANSGRALSASDADAAIERLSTRAAKAAPTTPAPSQNSEPGQLPAFLTLSEIWHLYRISDRYARGRITSRLKEAARKNDALIERKLVKGRKRALNHYDAQLVSTAVAEERRLRRESSP